MDFMKVCHGFYVFYLVSYFFSQGRTVNYQFIISIFFIIVRRIGMLVNIFSIFFFYVNICYIRKFFGTRLVLFIN